MSNEFIKKIDETFKELCATCEWVNLGNYDKNLVLFTRIFNTRPFEFSFDDSIDPEDYNYYGMSFPEDEEKDETIINDFYPVCIPKGLDVAKTSKNVLKEYGKEAYFISSNIMITEEFLFSTSGWGFLTTSKIPERMKKCYVDYDKDITFGYVSCGQHGFKTTNMKVVDLCTEDNFKLNYNDDLPWDKLNDFVNEEHSGLSVLHGIPGCGKSSLIRHLIATNKDTHFYWLDQALLSQVNNSDFLDFLLDHKNSVFILEDCELLLHDRNQGGNGLIASLLNMSDGILGDSLHIKFLCTFNADLRSIDKALLRKGRLKIKYELKALTKDKVTALFNKLGINEEAKEMPLCDVYNYGTENGAEVKTKRMGF